MHTTPRGRPTGGGRRVQIEGGEGVVVLTMQDGDVVMSGLDGGVSTAPEEAAESVPGVAESMPGAAESKTAEERAAKRRARKREYNRRWRAANPEKAREAYRKYYERNRERVRERKRRWRAANPERVRERKRRWRAVNREKVREYNREYNRRWLAANPERERERKQKYYKAHRERVRERKQKYYKAHRERLLEAARKYHERNRDRMAEYFRKRHEARRAAWDAFLKAEGRTQCLACGYDEDIRNIHEHHVKFPKLFKPSAFTTRRPCTEENKEELRRELDKCIPLCAYCHRAYHSKKGRAKVVENIQKRHVAMLAYALFRANQGAAKTQQKEDPKSGD